MIKNLKLKGFSLVEVMILFTVLSVIMAASLSMVTKRTLTPTQNKVSHGVYRCISLSNGKYLQETYNGTRRVGLPQEVASCSFRVPKAAMFKVDLYSAGSGGMEQAYISSRISGSATNAMYSLNSMTNNTPNQLFIPSDRDLYNYFAGKFYVDSIYTGDAGFGGGVIATYPSVVDSSCVSDDDKKAIAERIRELEEELQKYKDFRYNRNGVRDEEIKKVYLWREPFSTNRATYSGSGRIYSDGDLRVNMDLKAIVPYANEDVVRYMKSYANQSKWNKNNRYRNYMEYLAQNRHIVMNGEEHGIDDCYIVDPMTNEKFNSLYLNDTIIGLYTACDFDNGEEDNPQFRKSMSYARSSFNSLCNIIYYALTDTDTIFSDDAIKNYLDKARASVMAKYTYTSADMGTLSRQELEEVRRRWTQNLHYDDDGGDDEYGSVNNLVWLMVNNMTSADRHKIMGTMDDDYNDSWSWGVRFRDVVDDMVDEAIDKKIADIEAELAKWRGMIDLPDNRYFRIINNSPGVYDNNSVLNNQVKQQMFDYCKLMFKPYYEYTKRFRKDDATIASNERNFNYDANRYHMSFGGTRMVVARGGNEGLGRMSVMMYQIGQSNGGGESFRTYATKIKSTHKPLMCKENNASECSSTNVEFTKALDANLSKTVTYSPGTNTIEAGDILNVDYSKDKNNTNLFRLDGTKRYVITSDGVDLASTERTTTKKRRALYNWITYTTTEHVKPYLLWDFPAYEGGPVATIRSLATGGKGPTVYIDEGNTATYSFPDGYCSKETWTCPNSDIGPSIIFASQSQSQSQTQTQTQTQTPSQAYVDENGIIHWTAEQIADFPKRTPPGPTQAEINAALRNKIIQGGNTQSGNTQSGNTQSGNTQRGNTQRGNRNLAYTIFSENGTNGEDSLINGLAHSSSKIIPMKESQMANVALTSFNQATSPLKQEPRLQTQSWIWSKTYQIGPAGNIGNLKSTIENDLGDNCTFNVAKPGQIYRPNKDTDINVLNNRLTTSMTCTSRGKQTLYLESKGNGYNTNLKGGSDISNNTYTWSDGINENGGSWEVRLNSGTPATSWTPTSMWSRAFRNIIIRDGNYDIKSQYNVGAAGAGTKLIDYCLARKGKYYAYIDYLINYPKTAFTDRYRSTTNTNCMFAKSDDPSCSFQSNFVYSSHDSNTNIIDSGFSNTKYAPGKYKGFNCYGVNDSDDAQSDEMYINADDPIVVNGVMSISAGQGGGGAVVITW